MFISDLVTIGQVSKQGYDVARKLVDDKRDIGSLDSYEQQFADTLENIFQNLLDTVPDGEMIRNLYDRNREEILSSLTETTLAEPNDAVDHLCKCFTSIVLKELDTDNLEPAVEDDIRDAIETAYHEAINEFIVETSSDPVDRWTVESLQSVQDNLIDVKEELQQLRPAFNHRPDLLGRHERFRRIYPDDENRWLTRVALELEVQDDGVIPFIEPESFETLTDPDIERVLVAGIAGAGKSRTLIKSIEELADRHSFALVVTVTEPPKQTADLAKAINEVHGDVLLIWDNLHRSPRLNFEDALLEMEQRLNEDHTLYVRATARQERLDTVLPDGWTLTEFRAAPDQSSTHAQWLKFDPVEISPLSGNDLKIFVESALDYHGVAADTVIRDAFINQAASADPTPFYIHSVCRSAEGKLTKEDVNELPSKAVEIWERAYTDLADRPQNLLQTLAILDILGVPASKKITRRVFRGVFDASGTKFAEHLDYLSSRGWINERSTYRETRLIVHDVRLEAVDLKLDDVYLDLFEFLLNDRSIRRFPNETGAVMNATFAELVYEKQLGFDPKKDAQDLFNRALELSTESTTVYTTYGGFLEDCDERYRAMEYYRKALDIDSRDVSALRGFERLIGHTVDRLDEQIERIETAKQKLTNKDDIGEEYNNSEIQAAYQELNEHQKTMRNQREKLREKEKEMDMYATMSEIAPEDVDEVIQNMGKLATALTNDQQEINESDGLSSTTDTEDDMDKSSGK